MDDRANLLPHNATPLEIALAAVDGRLDDIDMGLIWRVKDPLLAPEWALPYLAWENSVDVWNNSWSLQTKRQVIAAAPEVHRVKGTVYAIEASFQAIGIEAELTEWWQTSPKGEPFTWELTAWACEGETSNDPIFTPDRVRDIIALVKAVKPVSRSFTYKIGVKWRADTYAVMFSSPIMLLFFKAENGLPDKADMAPRAVLVSEPIVTLEFKAENGLPQETVANPSALLTSQATMIYYMTTEN